MKKVLILTASFGEGHNTASRSIRDALEQQPEKVTVEVVDLFQSSYGMVSTLIRKTHLQVVQHTPRLWEAIYNWLDKSSKLERQFGMMSRLQNAIIDLAQEFQPDCVISTYPAYGHVIREAFKDHAELPFPFLTVITDSISVNSVWYKAPSDYFCVANEETAQVLREAGIKTDRIKVTGFPVNPVFTEKSIPEMVVPEGREKIKVLYIINSGKKKARKTVRAILENPTVELTVTVGRDSKLKAELLELTEKDKERVTVLGWTNLMPQLMRTHHLIFSKAGGATVQEAIAARTPMIVNQIIPGQEEGNARLIEQLEIGRICEEPAEAAKVIESAFKKGGAGWLAWREKLQGVSRPDAAGKIAELALELGADRGGPEEGLVEKSRSIIPLPGSSAAAVSRSLNGQMLLCDFHIHTNYSDGALSLPEVVDLYGRHGFDCICVTDHLADPRRLLGKITRISNLVLSPHQLDEYFEFLERERRRAWRQYNMLLLTGIEFNKDGLTKKSSAHLLGVDLKFPIDPALDLPETILQIHSQGGLAIASHPHIMRSEWGKNTLYLWEHQDIYAPLLDAWEIANRTNIFTPIGLKNLPFVANSDFHKPRHINSWKTLLHCEKHPEAIKETIRSNKHIALTFFRDSRDDCAPVALPMAAREPAAGLGMPAFGCALS